MLMVDPARVDVEMMLTRGELRCPDCSGVLRPWGYARERVVRRVRGLLTRIRPRRSSCRACRRTHVLLPVWMLLRRADCVATIGAALTAKAAGSGFRPIAKALGVPEFTVRGWLRRFSVHASGWRGFFTTLAMDLDPEPGPIQARGSGFGDAVEVIGLAAAAAVRRFGTRPVWEFVSAACAGRLLAPDPGFGWRPGADGIANTS
jgi:hypothetical protein